MRNVIKPVLFVFLIAAAVSCKKDAKAPAADEISQDVLNKISALGFTNKDVIKDEDGYIVEGDILLTEEHLNGAANSQFLRVGTEEQYRTFNLVTSLPRVITVSVSSQLPTFISNGVNEAINRYNAQSLLITFQRVSSGGNISIVKGNGSYLASAGFPTSGGNPYSQIKVNSTQLNGQPLGTVGSVIAHEMGHCIGFRHTDYMNRAYSCGGSPVNEGASTVGAVLVPGTPSGPDPNSWMLSCIGSGQNRPFNANDRTALAYLY